MKTKCTLIGSILSLVSSAANVVLNSFIVFILCLAIGIGSSLSGENVSTLETNLQFIFLISVLLISIVNICLSSVLLVKKKKRVLPIRIIFLVFIALSISLNLVLVYINIISPIFIAFASFSLINIAVFTCILIDTIRNRKNVQSQQNNDEEKTVEENKIDL